MRCRIPLPKPNAFLMQLHVSPMDAMELHARRRTPALLADARVGGGKRSVISVTSVIPYIFQDVRRQLDSVMGTVTSVMGTVTKAITNVTLVTSVIRDVIVMLLIIGVFLRR
jgi:hypothetical protein